VVLSFRSLDQKWLFQINNARDQHGQAGVLLSSGVNIRVGNNVTTNWTRRVLPTASLLEYARARPALKIGIGDIVNIGGDIGAAIRLGFDGVSCYYGDCTAFYQDIANTFGPIVIRWISDWFQDKSMPKWLKNDIADVAAVGHSSQLPALYIAGLREFGATQNALERYVTTIIASRENLTFTAAERVFVSLQQSIVQSGDNRAGQALAQAIGRMR
jgi:hypothetical protein